MISARICSSHFSEADFERDLVNELLHLPVRKILKGQAIPTLNLAAQDNNPRKRQSAENRSTLASKRAHTESVAARKQIVDVLLQETSVQKKDAEIQVNNAGDLAALVSKTNF